MSSEPPTIREPDQDVDFDGMDGDSLLRQPKFQESLKFLEDVKKRFETTQPDVYPTFIQALSKFNQAAPQTQEEADRNIAEIHAKVTILFHGHQDLLDRFESTLPAEYFHQRARSEGQIG
ncbi:Paired amphipathic helix protein Sin3-like 1 [Colletotrichum fructicola]|uniref:Paired amphipathic helix protein Sin3-like 1 n=1 Tax=Colletotrichum siamense TaxID=690259 RepID=A0A9P5EZ10_COLSI|nr:Paired amphipathic helix protein Sin3-like 1 [Colletotrichum siamense]KAF4862367.1 Paired amphipathic helix protein Sin3-like 1 [Colletotrichum siamense]KAF4889441.1 Paired amphipathic helix protein Sin3-like 1 [Colletotrichum fructicola]